MSKDTGGPAFPCEHPVRIDDDNKYTPSGMTLRDYFAAKVMQGLMSNSIESYGILTAAGIAYVAADAMLAERNK